MATAAKVQKDVLGQIKPNRDQRKQIETVSKKALALANKFSKKYKGKAMLAGSITRGTWLPDKMEFDVFVLFPEKLNQKQLEKAGLDVGKKVIDGLKGKHELRYAQHPYVSGTIDGVSIDVVPAFAVESADKIKSAVDRTPFHVKFVDKKLPKKLADDVILLKKVLKNADAYGADTKTEGYSGYVCELLVIHYGGFTNLIKAAKNWKPGEVIDIQGDWDKNDHEKLRKQFFGQPLIIIDPTDKNRNTSAALSGKNFMKLRKIASDYSANPSEEFFIGKGNSSISDKELVEKQSMRHTQLLFIKFLPPKGVDDVVYPQMRKFAERLQGILEESQNEFKVMNKDVFTDGSYLSGVLLELEVSKLPLVQKRVGPSIFDEEGSKNFIEKYSQSLAGPYVEGTNWVAEINRPFITAADKIRESLTKPSEELLASGVPKLVAERVVKGFDVISEVEVLSEELKRNPAFGIFLKKYFNKEKLA